MKKCLFALLFIVSNTILYSQITGGNNTYDFLSLSYSARITALGGNLITVRDNDLALAAHNPAALNSEMHNSASIQQSIYYSGINYGYAGYAYHISKIPLTLQAGIQYISYGKFTRTSEIGEEAGEFGANENAINLGVSYMATENLSFGSTQKIILSNFEGYNSVGWASDWAVMYSDTSKRMTFSLVLRNIGSQFTKYTVDGKRHRLPFDAQLGLSHRLKYLPLRFSVIGHQLHRWNVRYDDPELREESFLLGNDPEPTDKVTAGEVVDNIFRHLIFNIELLLGKKDVFRLRIGYNRLRQGEMAVPGLRSLSGFSAGFGIKIYKFNIDYGFSAQHIGGIMHHFGISTRFNDF